jgi:hypothetical protein
VAGREGKRGECQTRLVYVWRETGAVRNARPSRGQAAAHPEEGAVERRREATWSSEGVGMGKTKTETATIELLIRASNLLMPSAKEAQR